MLVVTSLLLHWRAPSLPELEHGGAAPRRAYARAMADGEGGDGELLLFEGAKRLSESALWRVHDAYFEESGVGAWASGDVPHAVTTGPVLARSYARLIEGLVEDCRAGHFGATDPASPLDVVELGAGSGRLGFQLLAVALDPARLFNRTGLSTC